MILGTASFVDAALLFMGGLVGTLYGFGRPGGKPAVGSPQERRAAVARRSLRIVGPLLMMGALVLVFLRSPPSANAPEWQVVSTSDGVCRVEMPGTPHTAESPSALEGFAKPATHQWLLVQENAQVQYYLSYTDIEGEYAELPHEQLLATIGANWFRAANSAGDAQWVSERDLSNNGWHGKELVIDREDKRLQNRWFVVEKRLYRAYVSTSRDDPHLHDAARFLDSIRILKKSDADRGP